MNFRLKKENLFANRRVKIEQSIYKDIAEELVNRLNKEYELEKERLTNNEFFNSIFLSNNFFITKIYIRNCSF